MSGDVSSLAVQLQGLRDSHASLISLLNSLIAKFRGYLTSGNTDSIAEVQGLLHAAEQRLGHAEACTSQFGLISSLVARSATAGQTMVSKSIARLMKDFESFRAEHDKLEMQFSKLASPACVSASEPLDSSSTEHPKEANTEPSKLPSTPTSSSTPSTDQLPAVVSKQLSEPVSPVNNPKNKVLEVVVEDTAVPVVVRSVTPSAAALMAGISLANSSQSKSVSSIVRKAAVASAIDDSDIYEDDLAEIAANCLSFDLNAEQRYRSIANNNTTNSRTSTIGSRRNLASFSAISIGAQHTFQQLMTSADGSARTPLGTSAALMSVFEDSDSDTEEYREAARKAAHSAAAAAAASAAQKRAEQAELRKGSEAMSMEEAAQQSVRRNLEREEAALPVLAMWMQKKSPSLLAGWQSRYVAVSRQNLYYWNEQFSTPVNEPTPIHIIPLFAVLTISAVSNDPCQFDVEARDSKHGDIRHYLFRTKTSAERDLWVAGLQAHHAHMLKALRFQTMQR